MDKGNIFKRIEKKFMLTEEMYRKLMPAVLEHMQLDEFGEDLICNLYCDTDDFVLIRRSIEKPVYKEKLRLRSYGVPKDKDRVYLELKKKYKGVVYKRRIKTTLAEAMGYIEKRTPIKDGGQIIKEIDYFMDMYGDPRPKVYIAYDRMAYYGKDDRALRVTFDRNIRYRTDDLRLDHGDRGKLLLEPGTRIMEVKADNSMPLWLADALTHNKIYTTSFSKYGQIYMKNRMEEKIC